MARRSGESWAMAVGLLVLVASAAAGERPASRAPMPLATVTIGREQTEPDSGLGGFLGGLSDSTDQFFGIAAARPDTAGDDSALAYGLAHPDELENGGLNFGYGPSFAFNRADGPVYGGTVSIGRPNRWGSLRGRLSYAVGSDDLLGSVEYRKRHRRGDAAYLLELSGGRYTAVMDQDHPDPGLSTARALLNGRDGQHYYREDGFEARLERETDTWRVGAGYRDKLESPLATTTSWNLTNRPILVFDNLPATFGRNHELSAEAGARLPVLPITGEIEYQTSGKAIGSDFEYRRTRAAMSGNFGLGRLASAVPQVAYGRLTPSVVPQQAFYLGGDHSLRSLPNAALGGTGVALARLDLIGTFDFLAAAHIPHPAMFPLQLGVFGATGAAWGDDPYGGATVPGVDWPDRETWRSEVGASIIYQPGLPDPTYMMRFNFAQAVGPHRESRWSFSYSRALDLVRVFSP